MTVSTGVGLYSGIDYEAYIEAVQSIGQRQISIIEVKQSILSSKSDSYGAVGTALTSLRDEVSNMLDMSDFNSLTASSSDSSSLGISASDDASIGSYSVEVKQLAQAHRMAAFGMATSDTAILDSELSSGFFKVQVGINPVSSYDITAATTLNDLRDMINDDDDADFSASIINDGTETEPYRLVLYAKEAGEDNEVSILTNDTQVQIGPFVTTTAEAGATNAFDGTLAVDWSAYTGPDDLNIVIKTTQAGEVVSPDADTTPQQSQAALYQISLDGGVTFGATEYQASSAAFTVPGSDGVSISFAAGTVDFVLDDEFTIDRSTADTTLVDPQDAIISIDGIEITRSSNTFTDVLDDLTFTAKAVTSGTVTASVSLSSGDIITKISGFQEALNNVISTIKAHTAYDAETGNSAPLFADSASRTIVNKLTNLVTTSVSGIDSQYNTLASIGMTLQEDGTVGLDTGTLTAAIDDDVESVMKLFAHVGDSTNSQVGYSSSTDNTKAGTYAVKITTPASRAMQETASLAGTLAADETLTFDYNDRVFSVALSAGDSPSTVISMMNSRFEQDSVALEAILVGDKVRIQTTAYGSDASFKVTSDQDAATANQLGIGTVQVTATGVDVAGTIAGRTALGTGQTLEASMSSDAYGLKLDITATTAMSTSFTFSRGVADQIFSQIDQYLNADTGMVTTRQDGIAETVASLNEQIEELEARLESEGDRIRSQFLVMEKLIAQYQSMGNYIASALSQSTSSSSS